MKAKTIRIFLFQTWSKTPFSFNKWNNKIIHKWPVLMLSNNILSKMEFKINYNYCPILNFRIMSKYSLLSIIFTKFSRIMKYNSNRLEIVVNFIPFKDTNLQIFVQTKMTQILNFACLTHNNYFNLKNNSK